MGLTPPLSSVCLHKAVQKCLDYRQFLFGAITTQLLCRCDTVATIVSIVSPYFDIPQN